VIDRLAASASTCIVWLVDWFYRPARPLFFPSHSLRAFCRASLSTTYRNCWLPGFTRNCASLRPPVQLLHRRGFCSPAQFPSFGPSIASFLDLPPTTSARRSKLASPYFPPVRNICARLPSLPSFFPYPYLYRTPAIPSRPAALSSRILPFSSVPYASSAASRPFFFLV